MPDHPTAARAAFALALAALFMLCVHLRVRLSTYTPRFNPEDEAGYYRTESALQYRYARMVARGERIPELDIDSQYPEGVSTRRELTLWMEYATGWAYRLLPVSNPPDFRRFVILWVAFVSSLSVPAFYLLGLRLTRSPPLALSAAAAYGLSWAAQSNVIASYVFESFALPLIHWSLAFFAGSLDPKERRPALQALASGLALAGALGSWHFTRFYFASFLLAEAYAFLRSKNDPKALKTLRSSLGIIMAVVFIAGSAVGSMRENLFVLSPAMIFGYGLLGALFFPGRALPIALLAGAALGLRVWTGPESGSYGHVYALFLAKILHGAKPLDPSVLSQETRALWMGPFNSPEPGFAVFALAPLGLMTLPKLISLLKRERPSNSSPTGHVFDGLFWLYAFGAALVLRLTQMLAFFLCLESLRLPERFLRKKWLIAGFVALAAMEGLKSFAPASRANPFMGIAASLTAAERHPRTSFENELRLLDWLKAQGGPKKPVLAGVAFSASLLAYASSPILIHPKFEAPGIRAKTAEFLKALYSDEEAFFRFCRKYGAKLFVYTVYDVLDETPDGPRYASGSMRLTPRTAAALFHFHPESLKLFRLVYQNEDFRIFAVGAEDPYPVQALEKLPIYDSGQFRSETLPDGSLRLDVAGVLKRIEAGRFKLLMARILGRMGREREALSAYEQAFAAWPPDEETRREHERFRAALERSR